MCQPVNYGRFIIVRLFYKKQNAVIRYDTIWIYIVLSFKFYVV